MSQSEMPCLTIAIAPLNASASRDIPTKTGDGVASHFAIWVVKAPYPGGSVHHDCIWSDSLSEIWPAWQQMFSPNPPAFGLKISFVPSEGRVSSYSSRLMLELGINLWQFIFNGPIANSFHQSLGIAIGKQQPLRLQLDIRDPNLIALPWEICQPQAGKPTISLNPQLRFSRTTTDVVPLSKVRTRDRLTPPSPPLVRGGPPDRSTPPSPPLLRGGSPDRLTPPSPLVRGGSADGLTPPSPPLVRGGSPDGLTPASPPSVRGGSPDPLSPPLVRGGWGGSADRLNILLVLGSDAEPERPNTRLQLQKEADALRQILQESSQGDRSISPPVPCHVDTLIQPTSAEAIQALETGNYNIMFYAGHGVKAPDGGQLLLRPDTTLSGTELAQLLVSSGVTLAVFNACWGAQPFIDENQQATPRSSLAEVLIHHGLPAVLAMRDEITDEEALSFIQTFATVLAQRMPIDRAMAIARQKLLTLYKFNQPAWSLPVLYMHPEFDGVLIPSFESLMTQLPDNSTTALNFSLPFACVRPVADGTQQFSPDRVWPIHGGRLTVGRRSANNLVIQERWVSQEHAEIFYRDLSSSQGNQASSYFLRDFSRYGTLILTEHGWQKIHRQEVPLKSGVQLKFGSSQGLTFEFAIG